MNPLEYLKNFEEVIQEALKRGAIVYRGEPTQILLDLDTPAAKSRFAVALPMFTGRINLIVKDRWASKSGKGEHVILQSDEPLPAIERVLIQACLGSDLNHELLSYLTGIRNGNPEPTVLFKPKPNVEGEVK